MTASALLSVGYVSRAHGIQGEIAVKTFDEDSRVFDHAHSLVVVLENGTTAKHRVVEARRAKAEWLLRLAGVNSRTAAETFRRAQVSVLREELPPPGKDEYFQGDLVGLRALASSGQLLGTLESIEHTGPVPNLVVRTPTGGELWVPFVETFVKSIDMQKGEIVMDPPEED